MKLLDQMAKAKAPAARGKKDKPTLEDPKYAGPIEQIVKAKAEQEHWKAMQLQAEDQLAPDALTVLTTASRRDQTVHSSVRVSAGAGGPALTFTVQNRYSPVPAEHLADLQEAFGEAAARDFFAESFELSLTPEAVSDEAFLSMLIEKIGQEEFRRRFKVEKTVKVTESLHRALVLDAQVAEKAAPFIAMQVIKPAKPSFRQ